MCSLPEEASHGDRLGLELGDGLEQLLHGAAGVDDVLHDQDVLAAEGVVKTLHPDDLNL